MTTDATKYRAKVTTLLQQVHPKLATTTRLEFKNCFGASAGYVNGHIFISCGRFGVAMRLPPEYLEEVFKLKGVRPLKYFPGGHVKREYAVFPQRMVEDTRKFKKLLDASIEYSLSKQ